jgi:hypothetical protein
MAVHYAGGGGGLLNSILGAATMAIPGMQSVAPYIAGGASLLNGDIGGAVGSIGGKMIGDGMAAAKERSAMNSAGLRRMNNTMMDAHQQNSNTLAPFGQIGQAYVDGSVDMPINMGSTDAWTRAHRQNVPGFNTDPVTGDLQKMRMPRGWR